MSIEHIKVVKKTEKSVESAIQKEVSKILQIL